VRKSSPVRASHVNAGTSIPRKELRSNKQRGRELRHPKLHAAVETSDATAVGGLALAARLSATLKAPRRIDAELSLLKTHRPFSESDHVLTHVYNLFLGGTCIEDIADLQHSEASRRILGAARIPDPTTAGDFLRRFGRDDIAGLDHVCDDLHRAAWKKRYGKRKRDLALVDIDSHVRHVYGEQKEGADFTYKGGFGYHPLVISLAETQECLRIVNRPGNVVSPDGADLALESVVPLLKERFRRIVVRGDSAFAQQPIYDTCERHGLHFAMVSPCHVNFEDLADAIPERSWKPFRAEREDRPACKKKRRRRGSNIRRRKARKRGKRDLKLERQWVAEIDYKPARSESTYRLVIRRQRIEESEQGQLFELWRYRFVITNLPKSVAAAEVVRLSYRRCDQENVIEQLQNGVAAMRMPTGSFLANWAYLVCARIAHNLKAWLAMLALPAEVMRWEWKRFRKAFVFVAARVVKRAGQVLVRIADSHRFADAFATGVRRLQI
jgi:hypothetical protein